MTQTQNKYPALTFNGRLPDAFWSKVDKTDQCWVWLGAISSSGYGMIRIDRKYHLVHRLSYANHAKGVPEGMVVDHMCHNKICVNPQHLRLTTHGQNHENYKGLPNHNKSGVRGVYWDNTTQSWRVIVQHDGKKHTKRGFADIASAEQYSVQLRNQLHTHNDADRTGERK